MNPLQIATSGMVAQQTRVDVIANNLANMNTTGFQRRRAEFNDLIYKQHARPDTKHSQATGDVPGGVARGHGVQLAAIYRVAEQGNLKQTGNPLDLAVQGTGLFQIALPSGETAYTRAGNFQLSPDGTLVTSQGYQLVPGIAVPGDVLDLTVNEAGELLATIEGNAVPANLGQFQLVRFPNEGGLKALGDNLFIESADSGAPLVGVPGTEGFGSVLQGFIETSNVNPVEEIAKLIRAMRAYEMNSKMVQTADQMMARLPSS